MGTFLYFWKVRSKGKARLCSEITIHLVLSKYQKYFFDNTAYFNIKRMDGGNVFLSDRVIESLKTNNRPSYRNMGSEYEKTKSGAVFDATITPYGRSFKNFNSCYLTCDGHVLDGGYNLVYVNGGCKTFNPPPPYDKPAVINHYNKVVTVAAMWSSGIFHFPMESLSAFAAVPPSLDLDGVFIHVGEGTDYVKEWMEIKGIPTDKIISDKLCSVGTLYVPQMGGCGNPFPEQIKWLGLQREPSSGNNLVIYAERTKTRIMPNNESVKQQVKAFSDSREDLEFYLHTDACMPSVKDQLEIFGKARYIFAPHGAGLVNLVACSRGTKVVEYFQDDSVNMCYARMCYILGLDYAGLKMEESVNIKNWLV